MDARFDHALQPVDRPNELALESALVVQVLREVGSAEAGLVE